MSCEAGTAEEVDAPGLEVRRGWWVPVVLASLLTWVGAVWIGIGGQGLAAVSVTRADLTYSAQGSVTWLAVNTALTAAGIALFTGYRRSPVGRVDGVALAGGVWTLGWVGLLSAFSSGFEFGGPTYPGGPPDTCVYASCWPGGYQGVALALPVITAVVVAAVLATLGRHKRWWIRAVLPGVVLIILTAVQVAVWESTVIPFFAQPAPFS